MLRLPSGSKIRQHDHLNAHGNKITHSPSKAALERAGIALAGFLAHQNTQHQNDGSDCQRCQHKHGWMHYDLQMKYSVGASYSLAAPLSICRLAYISVYYFCKKLLIYLSWIDILFDAG